MGGHQLSTSSSQVRDERVGFNLSALSSQLLVANGTVGLSREAAMQNSPGF
jgi:hypothetical protein